MFHLYSKVYLDFDHNLSAYESRIVISEKYGATDKSQEFKTQYAFGNTISDIIGKDKNFDNELDFFKQIKNLANGDRFIIYCDRAAFLHLFIAWHKILLDVTDATPVWNSWRLFVEKESYRSAVTETVSHVQYDNIKVNNWSEEEFASKFSSIVVSKDPAWLQSIIFDLGLEYLMSSYLNGVSSVKSVFESKLKLLANRSLQYELYDAKINLTSNAFNKTLHDLLDIDCPDSVDDLLSHPSLEIFKDPQVWNETYQLIPSDSFGSVDISKLSKEKIELLIAAFKVVRQNLEKFQLDSPLVKKIYWLNWINNESISDSQLEDIIQSDEFCSRELISSSDYANVNILLVDWIITNYKNNNLTPIETLTISV